MKRKLIAGAAALLLGSLTAAADEGMWMVHAISRALEADMQARGCRLSAGEIYNADAPGAALCDAVVSLDFACTGSIISDEGLLITNHHCAFADIHALSSNEHNYLEEGFWAMLREQEMPVPGKNALFLRKVIDVTEEVETLSRKLAGEGKPAGMRKLSAIMEKRYSGNGLQASLESMWAGSKYYLCLYEVYSDIRLVAAPPLCVAAFGGDIDNWEWPQHKCDFAMYRIYCAPDGSPASYSEENVPLRPRRKLEISLNGCREGDFAMVLGYPGSTHRYNSSSKLEFEQNVSLPISSGVRGKIMGIMKTAMEKDPELKLKYSERFFSLSNVQEYEEGTLECYRRFAVADEKRALEEELGEWIGADAGRRERWGSLLGDLDANYKAISELKRDENYYRECLVRGSSVFLVAVRLSGKMKQNWKSLHKLYSSLDLDLERRIFRCCLEEYLSNVSAKHLGPYQKELLQRFGSDWDAICSEVWDKSALSDPERFGKLENCRELCENDPLLRFYNDVKIVDFHKEEESLCKKDVLSLGREYTRALYGMRLDKGIMQYPDANSTMRLSYGRVSSLSPRDAVLLDWKTSVAGILQKEEKDSYDFSLRKDWRDMLETSPFCKRFNWNGEVDFLTDNDITGGNSGSPVLDSRGRLIGLAFDGNKESLAGDSSYTRDYNKSINVDIRYVLYVLGEYAGMERIITELGLRNW
ncbi:MAG: S46 family peptidase [Candidatus Cryptobacteroides sp.]|nr:S46 family peptidase [Candidatus Cryptobacteroides sp.]